MAGEPGRLRQALVSRVKIEGALLARLLDGPYGEAKIEAFIHLARAPHLALDRGLKF